MPVAWVGTHRHDARGDNEAYVFTHLFRLRLDLPPGARTLTLPDDEHLRILAITAARNDNDAVVAAQPFTDPEIGTVVHVEAPEKVFIDRTAVTLTSPNPGATIRYTLDGSEPTATSPVYAEPLRLERTTTVKARAFAPGLDDRFVATATFTRVAPRDAAAVAAGVARARPVVPDVRGRLAQTARLRRAQADRPSSPSPPSSFRRTAPPTASAWRARASSRCLPTASTTSSCAPRTRSELRLDGRAVVENESPDFISRFGTAALKAGLHPIEVRYVHGTFFIKGLELEMDVPGAPLAPVPPGRLFHLREAK